MIRSMTGFGKHTVKTPYGEIIAEIKTLNHKSLSIACHPFNGFFMLEEKIKKIFDGKIFRGKVFVKITRENTGKKKSLKKVEINTDIVQDYVKKIKKVQKELGISGELCARDLINLPGVIEGVAGQKEEKAIWPYMEKALQKACINLVDFRGKEGKRLVKDFKMRIRIIKQNITQTKKNDKQNVIKFRKKLIQMIKDVSEKIEPDKNKIETEVASFAKNCDITEEIIRMEGHLEAYTEVMNGKQFDVGKKLDFIAQEMQREANTIGAKSGDFRISKSVIEIKSEIEKLREQIRNIE